MFDSIPSGAAAAAVAEDEAAAVVAAAASVSPMEESDEPPPAPGGDDTEPETDPSPPLTASIIQSPSKPVPPPAVVPPPVVVKPTPAANSTNKKGKITLLSSGGSKRGKLQSEKAARAAKITAAAQSETKTDAKHESNKQTEVVVKAAAKKPPAPPAPVVETACVVCGRNDASDEESEADSELGPNPILLCDSCNAEYHLRCLTPPLSAVPKGKWFCPKCGASGGRGSKRKGTPASVVAASELDAANQMDHTDRTSSKRIKPSTLPTVKESGGATVAVAVVTAAPAPAPAPSVVSAKKSEPSLAAASGDVLSIAFGRPPPVQPPVPVVVVAPPVRPSALSTAEREEFTRFTELLRRGGSLSAGTELFQYMKLKEILTRERIERELAFKREWFSHAETTKRYTQIDPRIKQWVTDTVIEPARQRISKHLPRYYTFASDIVLTSPPAAQLKSPVQDTLQLIGELQRTGTCSVWKPVGARFSDTDIITPFVARSAPATATTDSKHATTQPSPPPPVGADPTIQSLLSSADASISEEEGTSADVVISSAAAFAALMDTCGAASGEWEIPISVRPHPSDPSTVVVMVDEPLIKRYGLCCTLVTVLFLTHSCLCGCVLKIRRFTAREINVMFFDAAFPVAATAAAGAIGSSAVCDFKSGHLRVGRTSSGGVASGSAARPSATAYKLWSLSEELELLIRTRVDAVIERSGTSGPSAAAAVQPIVCLTRMEYLRPVQRWEQPTPSEYIRCWSHTVLDSNLLWLARIDPTALAANAVVGASVLPLQKLLSTGVDEAVGFGADTDRMARTSLQLLRIILRALKALKPVCFVFFFCLFGVSVCSDPQRCLICLGFVSVESRCGRYDRAGISQSVCSRHTRQFGLF